VLSRVETLFFPFSPDPIPYDKTLMLQAIQRLSNAPYRILAIAKCDLRALLRAAARHRPLRRMRPGGARFITGAVDRMDGGSGGAGLRFVVAAAESETADTSPKSPLRGGDPRRRKRPRLGGFEGLQLDYLDRGDKIELIIISPANPVLYVDVNQDGLPDAGDLSYATDGQTPCVRRVGTADDSGTCNETTSRATVCSQQSAGINRVTWTIPKQELRITGSGADIVIEIFNAVAQKAQYYPDNQLFRRVYHLILKPVDSTGTTHGAEEPSGARPPTPEPPRLSAENPVKAKPPASAATTDLQAPRIVSFNSDVGSVAAGGAVRLTWSVTGNVSNVR